MVEDHWSDLEGSELRTDDDTWELTGDVEILETGDVVGLVARRTDEVSGDTATLHFTAESRGSLNPGNLGTHFDQVDREGDDHHLLVKTDGRTYRYELQRIEYE